MNRKLSQLMCCACVLAAVGLAQPQTPPTEVVLHNFAPPPKGSNPAVDLIRDPAGNLYGTTNYGGPQNAGVVFRLGASGRYTVLYAFTGGADGGYPYAGVIGDSAGNLYGTTDGGGTGHFGVVYKLDRTGRETVLYNFTGGADGGYPHAGVIRDSSGNLYGTTNLGGASGAGVVYKVDTAGHETVLYSFTGRTDGDVPIGGVVRDPAGNLYGTTQYGGNALGVVYKVDPAGHETVLHAFAITGADAGIPVGGVIRDSAGNLYGVTSSFVYKVTAAGDETVLYTFTGAADGGEPQGNVVRDPAGNLYGTTFLGGSHDWGVVYKIDPSGHQTVLYSFTDGADGGCPSAGLIRDQAGNLYGTTLFGGPGNLGTLFKLSTTGQETVLSGFPATGDGFQPLAGVTRDAAGNLYGATSLGGAFDRGAVYELDAAGHETVLYSFPSGLGGYPTAGVVLDPIGNLYGTTLADGGSVYKVDTSGHATVLHAFTSGDDGYSPYAGVALDSAGNIYGTTYSGGNNGNTGQGIVYKLDAAGNETILHVFTGRNDGAYPFAGVVLDSAGNLYGTTSGLPGTVYKLDPSGHETVLHNFGNAGDGVYPYAGVILDGAGNLYGTTSQGGAAFYGVVYMLDPAGHETVLHSFTGPPDGDGPVAGVVRDSSGNLYGTTQYGGTASKGVVFMLDVTGHETILHSFTGGADGQYPTGGVILDSAGNIYGTAQSGGKRSGGIVFKLKRR